MQIRLQCGCGESSCLEWAVVETGCRAWCSRTLPSPATSGDSTSATSALRLPLPPPLPRQDSSSWFPLVLLASGCFGGARSWCDYLSRSKSTNRTRKDLRKHLISHHIFLIIIWKHVIYNWPYPHIPTHSSDHSTLSVQNNNMMEIMSPSMQLSYFQLIPAFCSQDMRTPSQYNPENLTYFLFQIHKATLSCLMISSSCCWDLWPRAMTLEKVHIYFLNFRVSWIQNWL